MTEAEFNLSDPDSDIRPVPWQQAHEHVRAGGTHSTDLFYEDGRIRRARPDPMDRAQRNAERDQRISDLACERAAAKSHPMFRERW